MPFMRSESCSFIWQPKVVTWKRFNGSIEEREGIGGGENLGGAANRPYGSVRRHGGWFRGDAVRRGDPCGADRAGNDRAADHTEGRRWAAPSASPRGVRGGTYGGGAAWALDRGGARLWQGRSAEPPERRGAVGHAADKRAADRRDRPAGKWPPEQGPPPGAPRDEGRHGPPRHPGHLPSLHAGRPRGFEHPALAA